MLRRALYTIFGAVSLMLFCIILSVVDVEPGGWTMLLLLIAVAAVCGIIAALLYDPHIVVSRLFAWAMIYLYFLQVLLNTQSELLIAAHRLRKHSNSLTCMYYALIDFYYEYVKELAEKASRCKVINIHSVKAVKR